MARADLIYELVKCGFNNSKEEFIKVVEALIAEERSKQHIVLAKKIEDLLALNRRNIKDTVIQANDNHKVFSEFIQEKMPTKDLSDLMLSKQCIEICDQFIEEQMRVDLLRSYGLEPRNKMLLIGPPGNGKTSIAEGIANALMLPLYTVKYENVIGSYLGETASKLSKLFEYVKTRKCVLFFDEFETLGKERGDEHETGEIKRVVSSLLLQIDNLPTHVIFIAATNHDQLLDTAVWRRFQVKIDIDKPSRRNIEIYLHKFEIRNNFSFGYEISTISKKLLGKSYAEIEEFCLSVYRQYILRIPISNCREITAKQMKNLFVKKDEEADSNG